MSLQNEPRSIDDYKDIVKILKLKIIKQNKRIQELQHKNKVYEEQINNITVRGQDIFINSRALIGLENEANIKKEQRQAELSTPKGKSDVMNSYVRALKKLGITPESVFRIADFAYKNYVEAAYFREILSKIKLDLNQKQVSSLIFIFDDACTGFITREDYYNSLHAYKVGVQENYQQYLQECAFKLSQLMYSDKTNIVSFYEQMQGKLKSKGGNSSAKRAVDLNVFQEQVKKCYGSKISLKQIVASFNSIDLESQGCLQKSNFLYTITSFINKMLTGEEMLSKKTPNEWSNLKSRMTDTVKGASPKKIQKQVDNSNFYSKMISKVNEEDLIPPEDCAQKLSKQFGVSLQKIYQQLVAYDFSFRLTLKAFKKGCKNVSSKLPPQFLTELYRKIDSEQKGSIYFSELINYYLANSTDNDIILKLLGKYLKNSDLDSQKFWSMFGHESDLDISRGKFMQILKKTFESSDDKLWGNFWFYFAKDRDAVNVGSIVAAMQKYEI